MDDAVTPKGVEHSEQPQRPNPPDGTGTRSHPPVLPEASAEASTDALLDGTAPHTDDTPTVVSKSGPRPNVQEHLFSGILRGRKLAHFELIEPIGVGGMAAVLRARDTQLERFVALKILPPEMAADPENIARFHQEARAAARLDHETIARVFFCGEDQSLHFIAFEFVEGENLRTLLERRGPLPVPEALHYMLQVATGLAHAAERGVVHRDIKPSNIIISPNGRAKLVDMGLARNLGPHTDHGLTQSGVTLGTFDYISPEQALEPRDADVRSDIYSLGCTFYHVLTGRAPVPEGTAARKLHHHQHVPPFDPRQLNPDIPDEVAAILGRMMAKDPRQRYQRAEHLVQHLLQATHQLGGGAAAAADGVLFVDAALPAPPRTRPILVVGCAAAIVVALVVLVGPSHDFRLPNGPGASSEHNKPYADPPPQPPGGLPDVGPVFPGGPPKPPPVVAETENFTITRVEGWRAFAEFAHNTVPGGSYEIEVKDLWSGAEDVAAEDRAGLVLRGKTIRLKGVDGGERPIVWTRYVAAGGEDKVWGIVFEAEKVELHNLRLVADVNNNWPGQQPAAGIFIRGAQAVEVSNCEFLQGGGEKPSQFSSVAIKSEPQTISKVTFQRCCFIAGKAVQRPGTAMDGEGWLTDVRAGGQTAVALQGAASVKATDCGFGPHASLFRFDGKKPGNQLSLQQCTALAGDEWALATLGENTFATVEASKCLFARASQAWGAPPPDGEMGMMGERRATTCLVRHHVPTPSYKGTNNRYQNIDAVLLPVNDTGAPAPPPLAEQLKGAGSDNEVLPPGAQPFKEKDPFALLQGALNPRELGDAFRLNFTELAALIVPTSPRGERSPQGERAVVGMQGSPWGKPEWDEKDLPAAGALAAAPKIVDPKAETNTTNGIYKSLAEALAAPKTGDVIKIRHNGELKMKDLSALRSGVSVTIQADDNAHPVLMLDDDTSDPPTALFRVQGGQLTLEGLGFRIRPNAAGSESRAVALLSGDGRVQFKGCWVTLDLDGRQAPLAAAALADLKEGMMPPPTGPKVVFDNCFVRGDGDLVAAHASRTFDLEVNESLVALTGSLLNVDTTAAKDAPAATTTKEISVRLTQMTAYLGGHLVRLRAANLSSLLPVHCAPVKSLLVSAYNHKKALLHLEAGPMDGEAARRRLPWNGDGNTYANFYTMLDQQAGESGAPMKATSDKWQESDVGSHSDDVRFPDPLGPEDGGISLAEVLPKHFLLKNAPKDVGVRKPLPSLTEH